MANELVVISLDQVREMAKTIVTSQLFGVKNVDQAVALMLVAQAEGLHPAIVARDYDIIHGRPAKKAEAMQRTFLEAGGKIEWHALDDTQADATFSHPQGGTVRIMWDMTRVKNAKIANAEMYQKFPRQMLRSRTVAEGCRTVWPLSTSGMYVSEEIQDMPAKEMGNAEVVGKSKALASSPIEQQNEISAALQAVGMREEYFLESAGKKSLAEIRNIKKAISWINDPLNAEPDTAKTGAADA